MTTPHLVLFDADHIKDYVFATGRLKEIRGASATVRRLTDTAPLRAWYEREFQPLGDFLKTNSGDRLIYAGGGGGALLIEDGERAQQFCRRFEAYYRRETGAATISAIAQPINGNEASAQEAARQKLERRKQSRPTTLAIPGGGAIRFCASDRLRPAVAALPNPDGGDPLLVSSATRGKHQASEQHQKALSTSKVWQRFIEQFPQNSDAAGWEHAIDRTQTLGDIGALSRPRGYLALVYADGDGMGKLLRSVAKEHGLRGYAQLSQAIEDGTTQAVATALFHAYQGHTPDARQGLPFEIITIGGDDVLLLCTAEHGLAIATELSEEIGRAIETQLGYRQNTISWSGRLSSSVGVVIAHDSLPIVQLEQRGRELLKLAKKAKDTKQGIGGVDFHIVSTPGLEAIKTVRGDAYTPASDTYLTMRPYNGTQMKQLLDDARQLKATLPGSKIADLYHACQGQRVAATLGTLAVHARLPTNTRKQLLDALVALDSIKNYPFTPPAGKHDTYRTALLDLLEAIQFVAREGQWGT